MDTCHPECESDRVLLGYFSPSAAKLVGWLTKKVGPLNETPGVLERYPSSGPAHPVFVSKQEIRNRMAELVDAGVNVRTLGL